MTGERCVVFECAGERLVGILHPGKPDAERGVVIVVGGPQYRVGSHRQFVLMARRFAAAGVPVLRFDYRGMGDAEGAPRVFDTVDDDIRAAVDYLMSELPGVRSVVLLGLCDAASANLIYAHTDQRVGGLVLLNPWVRTSQSEAKAYLRHYYLQRLLQRAFWRKILAGEFKLWQSLTEFLQAKRAARGEGERGEMGDTAFLGRMLAGLINFQGPIFLLISGRDLTAQEFVDLCRHDTRWSRAFRRAAVCNCRIANADHTLSTAEDLNLASHECTKWFQKSQESSVPNRT